MKPSMQHSSLGSSHASMQPLVLQPFASLSPPNLPTHDLELAYAAFHLEQHEQDMNDAIRIAGLCELEYASPEPPTNPTYHQPGQEPHPDAFRAATRQSWKRQSTTKPPTVKKSRISQAVFNPNPDASNDHVGVAKRTVANLNGYEAQLKPLMNAVKQAREAQQGSHFYGSSGVPVAGSGSYDASRDPRLRGSVS